LLLSQLQLLPSAIVAHVARCRAGVVVTVVVAIIVVVISHCSGAIVTIIFFGDW